MRLGEYIKAYRKRHGLTQKQLAFILEVPGSDSDISKLERGKKKNLTKLRIRFLALVTASSLFKLRDARWLIANLNDLTEEETNFLYTAAFFNFAIK